MARHFQGYKPYQCTEMILVVDPHDSTSVTVRQCLHREVDPPRLNLHRVRAHGHERKKKSPKASDEGSKGKQATSKSSSARKSSPYSKPDTQTRRAAQLSQRLMPEPTSCASSSFVTLDVPQCGYHVYSDWATPASSLASSPASAGSPPPCSPYSTPSPTYSGVTSPSPSPSPSPSYSWDTPLPQPTSGPSIVGHDEFPSPESLDQWLSGLSTEALQIVNKEMETFSRTLGLEYHPFSS